jgi:hypothetical protein
MAVTPDVAKAIIRALRAWGAKCQQLASTIEDSL